MRRRILVVINLLLGLMAPFAIDSAYAQHGALPEAPQIDPKDAQAIRDVVQSQLDAFAEDDAAKAFNLATSATRSMLGNPDNFLRLIKEQYPPIYRHRLALFSLPQIANGQAFQIVRLTDTDNQVWLAIYQMQQEPDGSWKIEDCKLFETTSVSI
jgi:uncharacterized protein (DUF2249 family)